MKPLLGLALSGILLFFSAPSSEARTLLDGKGIPVVSDPKDLSLVDFKPLIAYLQADLKNKGDLGPLRRLAANCKAARLGLPDTKTQKMFGGAVVSKGSSGLTSSVLVLQGDIQQEKMAAEFDRDSREYRKIYGQETQVGQREVGGVNFKTYGYVERPYSIYFGALPKQKCVVLAAVPKEDQGVLEETVNVLKGEEKLNEQAPAEVDTQMTLEFTPREVERMVKFNRPSGGLRAKVAGSMKTLAGKLGIPHSDDETVPLEERIRGQIAQSESVIAKYHWERESQKASAYSVTYQIRMKSTETAEKLREMIAEQVTRMTERTARDDEKDSLGRISIQTSDRDVNFTFLLDTPEAQYQHASLLVAQTLRYKNLTSFLDRYGNTN